MLVLGVNLRWKGIIIFEARDYYSSQVHICQLLDGRLILKEDLDLFDLCEPSDSKGQQLLPLRLIHKVVILAEVHKELHASSKSNFTAATPPLKEGEGVLQHAFLIVPS